MKGIQITEISPVKLTVCPNCQEQFEGGGVRLLVKIFHEDYTDNIPYVYVMNSRYLRCCSKECAEEMDECVIDYIKSWEEEAMTTPSAIREGTA